MSTTVLPQTRMKVPEFLAWAERQPQGRYELVDGEIVAMAPERVRPNLVKLAVARALEDAVKLAGLPCTVFTDGVAVVINDETTREPDASVQCGVEADLDSMTIGAPLVVVEATSPSSERHDSHARLIEYFSPESIRHYLIVIAEKRVVLHHERDPRGEIVTRIAREGEIMPAPPGMSVAVEALLGPASTAAQEVG
jgi:Uma2 family endonuclease